MPRAVKVKFHEIIETVLKHEGGYVNDKDDPGGETKYGISKRSFPQYDIKALSEDDAKDYGKLYKDIFDVQNEYVRLESVEKKSDKQKEKLESLKEKLATTKRLIVDAETSMQSLFDHTADIKAQNRLLLWYTLMLTHIQREGDEEPLPYFEGEDFDQKLEDYYSKEDETSDLYEAVVKKVTTVLAFWFFNQASTPDEFNKLIEDMEQGDL